MHDFRGRVALVTGSTKGIGRSLALELAKNGAEVVINGRDAGAVATTVSKLSSALDSTDGAGVFHGSAFDATDATEVRDAVNLVAQEVGTIDILINNAGVQVRGPLIDMDVQDWRDVIETNLTAPFIVGQAVARGMIELGHGVIINICSVQSSLARNTTAPYAASKSGLAGLTRAMCAEWASSGIRTNGLAPGYLATDLNTALVDDPEFDEWLKKRTPAGRWGTVDDMVGPALWLCSDDARFVNGQIVYADGGLTAVL